jgi:Fur family iron response transcriptional regulator
MNSRHKHGEKKYQSSADLLQDAGLRPTKQRLALAEILFDGCDKHVTAEQVHALAVKKRLAVSLATIYNTLNSFTAAGLMREVVIDGSQVHFDTNIGDHYHLFDEKTGRVTDIPASAVRFMQLPKLPEGKVLSRVDVVVRVHSAR